MALIRERLMPDNAVYYHVAYVVSAVVYALYAVSIYARRKRVRAATHGDGGASAR